MITINTSTHGTAPAVVRAIAGAVQPEKIKPVIGAAVVKSFQVHLFAANRSKPNALGGARKNFYRRAANATAYTVLPDGVQISVNERGIRQRVVGGTIRPKTKKFLTIPVVAEAHGKRASEFPDLVVIFDRNGRPVGLGRREAGDAVVQRAGRVTGASGVRMIFRLAKSATQQPDPSVVPGAFEIAAAVISAVNSHVDRAVARARSSASSKSSASPTSSA